MKNMRLIVLAILVNLILINVSYSQSKDIKGLFAFGWANNFPNTPAFDLSYIDGFTAYTGWDLVEAEENKYDWSALDVLLKKAKKTNKILNIGIYPGTNSPRWLHNYKIEYIEWEEILYEDVARVAGSKTRKNRSPLPWDPVYLSKWKNFIKALATKYGSDKSVGYIALTGPTIQDLAMGITLSDKQDIDRFKSMGYSDNIMISAWCEVMDYYAEVLPNKKWALAVAPLIIGAKNPWPAYKIVDYGLNKYPDNIIVMGVYLNDTWFNSRGPIFTNNQLIRMSSQYTVTGFQMAQSVRRNASWKQQKKIVANLLDSFKNGFDLGISFLEVWHNADIVIPRTNLPNTTYINDLKYIHTLLIEKTPKDLITYTGEFNIIYTRKEIIRSDQ